MKGATLPVRCAPGNFIKVDAHGHLTCIAPPVSACGPSGVLVVSPGRVACAYGSQALGDQSWVDLFDHGGGRERE